jgi:hypothetical protein
VNRILSPAQRAVLETLLPSGAHPTLPGVLETGFEGFYADFEKTALPSMRLGFKAAVFFAQWVSPLLIFRLPPLSRLSPETRERAIEAMGQSRFYLVRQLVLLLKAVTCFGYGADPRVRAAVGYRDRG